MLEILSSAIRKKILIQGINQNMDKGLIVQIYASAFVGTVESWILNHMAEQIWTLFERNDIK
jgi:hypothetical protein